MRFPVCDYLSLRRSFLECQSRDSFHHSNHQPTSTIAKNTGWNVFLENSRNCRSLLSSDAIAIRGTLVSRLRKKKKGVRRKPMFAHRHISHRLSPRQNQLIFPHFFSSLYSFFLCYCSRSFFFAAFGVLL